jgi:universal stress protein A
MARDSHIDMTSKDLAGRLVAISFEVSPVLDVRKGNDRMLPIKKIIAPTDFSDRSITAIATAAELADHFSAEVVLVHVLYPVPPTVPTAPAVAAQTPLNLEAYREALITEAEKNLDTLIKPKLPAGIHYRTETRWGSPAETIIDMAAKESADLIVICTRGATGLSRFVSGSVAEKVVRLSDVPVLTVQANDDE